MARPAKPGLPAAVELAAMLLCQRMPKYVIHKAINAQMRNEYREGVPARSFERILARARDLIVGNDTKGRKELRNESRRFYEGLIADPRTPPAVKVRAQECLDRLYGLAIFRVVHTGTGEGGAIKTESTVTQKLDLSKLGVEDLRKLRELRVKAEGGAGTAPSNN